MLISSPCLNDDNMASYCQHVYCIILFIYTYVPPFILRTLCLPGIQREGERERDRHIYIYIHIFQRGQADRPSQTGIEKSMVASLISTTSLI